MERPMLADPERIKRLAQARDGLVDQWLAICGPLDKLALGHYLRDGSCPENVPRPLRLAQQRLLAALDLPESQILEGAA